MMRHKPQEGAGDCGGYKLSFGPIERFLQLGLRDIFSLCVRVRTAFLKVQAIEMQKVKLKWRQR